MSADDPIEYLASVSGGRTSGPWRAECDALPDLPRYPYEVVSDDRVTLAFCPEDAGNQDARAIALLGSVADEVVALVRVVMEPDGAGNPDCSFCVLRADDESHEDDCVVGALLAAIRSHMDREGEP